MYPFSRLFSDELIAALGWTVLHSLWQSLLLALLLAAALYAFRGYSARRRYLLANAALALLLLASGGTFLYLYQPLAGGEPVSPEVFLLIAGAAPGSVALEQSPWWQAWPAYFQEHLPLIVTLWLLGASVFGLRLLGSLLCVRALRHRGVRPVAGHWQDRLRGLAHRLGVRRPVGLLESSRITVPMVVGHLKPVVLLPLGVVNGLSPRQVEAILAHEIAHVARADYLFNLLQSLVEVLYYFNPAVWWISARIREEREHCCDDVAVALCGDSIDYARALVQLQEWSLGRPQLAMTLLGPRRQLLQRVRRLLQPGADRGGVPSGPFAAPGLLLFFLILLSVGLGDPAIAARPGAAGLSPATRPGAVLPALAPLPLPSEAWVPSMGPGALDTIPKGRSRLEIVRGDDSHVEVVTEEGAVRSLRFDGREVPADSLDDYQGMVEAWYEGLQADRGEVRGWVVPRAPRPPRPDRPPLPDRPPRPPLPPVPPAPPFIGAQAKVTSETDEEGNTVIRVESANGEETRIEIKKESGEEPGIYLDGKKIDPEESTIILKNLPRYGLFPFEREAFEDLVESSAEVAAGFRIRMDSLSMELDSLRGFRFNLPDGDWHWNDSLSFERAWRDAPVVIDVDSILDRTLSFSFDDPGAGRNYWDEEVREVFEREMREDGILAPGETSYQLTFSSSFFEVNGQEQEKAVLKRYVALYEEVTGSRLRPSTRFVISRNGD